MAEIRIEKIGPSRKLLIIPDDSIELEQLRDFCWASLVLSCRLRNDPAYKLETLEIKSVTT